MTIFRSLYNHISVALLLKGVEDTNVKSVEGNTFDQRNRVYKRYLEKFHVAALTLGNRKPCGPNFLVVI